MFFDPMYLLVIGIGMALSIWASVKTKGTFHKYSQFTTRSRMTGADIAKAIMRDANVNDVTVEMVGKVKGKRKTLASGGFDAMEPGTGTVKLKLTKAAKKALTKKGKQSGRVLVSSAERDKTTSKKAKLVGKKKKGRKGGKK